MRLGSREKIFAAILSLAAVMLGAGASLFSHPPPIASRPPHRESPPAAETPLAWTNIAHVVEHQPEVPGPVRPPVTLPQPFGDLIRLIQPWSLELDIERDGRLRFASPVPCRPLARVPASDAVPDVVVLLETLKNLKISGFILTPALRAVHLGGCRLRPGDEFRLVGNRVIRAKDRPGEFRLREIKSDSLVLEHLASGSTLIRPCGRGHR